MALLKIAKLGHPKIRHGAQLVALDELQSPDVQEFIQDLVETMRDVHGVGIAAPQVHVSKQIIAVEVLSDNPRYPNQAEVPLTILVNPKIVEHVKETENGWEGCLSVPDLRGLVSRWTRVRVQALDRHGQELEFDVQGFYARVIQHEVDHLQGQVFLDRLSDLSTLTYLREYEQYWKSS